MSEYLYSPSDVAILQSPDATVAFKLKVIAEAIPRTDSHFRDLGIAPVVGEISRLLETQRATVHSGLITQAETLVSTLGTQAMNISSISIWSAMIARANAGSLLFRLISGLREGKMYDRQAKAVA